MNIYVWLKLEKWMSGWGKVGKDEESLKQVKMIGWEECIDKNALKKWRLG